MSVPRLVAFPAFFLENNDFIVLDMVEDLCLDAASGRGEDGVFAVDFSDGVDCDGLANCGFLPGDEELVPLFHQILFIGYLDQRLHSFSYSLMIKVSNIANFFQVQKGKGVLFTEERSCREAPG